jgi:hypothetical protein
MMTVPKYRSHAATTANVREAVASGSEIEITPDMLHAGLACLHGTICRNGEVYDYEESLAAIYRATAAHDPTRLGPSVSLADLASP